MLFDLNSSCSLLLSLTPYFACFQTWLPMVIVMQERDNEWFEQSFEACIFSCWLTSPHLLCPLVFCSITLFLSLHLPFGSHQWLCNERCVWRRRNETVPGGGYTGISGEILSVRPKYMSAHVK